MQELRWHQRRRHVRIRGKQLVLCAGTTALEVVHQAHLVLELGVATQFVCGAVEVLVLDIFWIKDGDLCEQELVLDGVGICIIQNCQTGT